MAPKKKPQGEGEEVEHESEGEGEDGEEPDYKALLTELYKKHNPAKRAIRPGRLVITLPPPLCTSSVPPVLWFLIKLLSLV